MTGEAQSTQRQTIAAEDESGSDGGSLSPSGNIALLVCAFLSALTTGATTYAFSFYGNTLKASLSLTQGELDTISSAGFTAGLMSWLPGIAVDRYGPKVCIVVGGCLSSACLTVYFLVGTQLLNVGRLVVPVLCALGFSIFCCSALITGAVFKLIVCHTKDTGSKGMAVGAAKGYVGLGSGVYTVLFQAMSGRGGFVSDLDFLPMAAFFSLAAATVPAMCLLPSNTDTPTKDSTTPFHFRIIYLGLCALAALVVGKSMIELFVEEQSHGKSRHEDDERPDFFMAAIVILLWWGPPLSFFLIPQSQSYEVEVEEPDSTPLKEDDIADDPALVSETGKADEVSEVANLTSQEDRIEDSQLETSLPKDRNLIQMLLTMPAWLMLWTTVILVGGGTMMTNQMGEMAEALYFDESVGKASLALFSVSQSFARVVTGALSEGALEWNVCNFHGIPRVVFFVVASALGACAHLVLALATTEVPFVVGVALSGLAFGMVWPLMVLVSGELFGKKHVGGNYMFYDGFTSAVGTLLLSKFVAQLVYEDHIEPGPDGTRSITCLGEGCFQSSHLVVAGLAATCIVTSVALVFSKLSRETYSALRSAAAGTPGQQMRPPRDYEHVITEES